MGDKTSTKRDMEIDNQQEGSTGVERSLDKINVKDVWNNLWHCRDFELEHFWHRSAFLSGMLLLCFTGYGCLVGDESFTLCSVRGFVLGEMLCLLSAIISILWIMMAKASKHWYEKYECAILAVTDWMGKCGHLDASVYVSAEEKGSKCFAGFGYEQIPGYGEEYQKKRPCNFLFSSRGGRFSPSKITICIGQVSLLFWSFLGIVHLTVYMKSTSLPCVAQVKTWLSTGWCVESIVSTFVWGLIVFAIWRVLIRLVLSTAED